jgi:dTDP-4-dehydrorhamnose 3,5-epimerase-like enzyme
MTIEKTAIQDLILITPTVLMMVIFLCSLIREKFHQNGIHYTFIQDNQSFSQKDLRGLHYQNPPCSNQTRTGISKERS